MKIRSGRRSLWRAAIWMVLIALYVLYRLWAALPHIPKEGRLTPATLPPFGVGREVEPGVIGHEVTLQRPGSETPERLWIYLPAAIETGGKPGSTPCVFVAPAGSRLFHGMALGDSDRPEQIPYAHAGFIVVAYDIDGDWPRDEKERGSLIRQHMVAFRSAEAGLLDARDAIDYALARIPQVDPHRLYTAGHSSAATLSLQVAEHEPRIAACVAYAPCTDVIGRVGEKALRTLDVLLPGETDFLRSLSPDTGAENLHCPVFLFHAEDDTNIPIARTEQFATRLRRTIPKVTFVRAASGGHYDSMIAQGLPGGIQWLKNQAASH